MLRTVLLVGSGYLLGHFSATKQGRRTMIGLAKAALAGSAGAEGALLGVADKVLDGLGKGNKDDKKEKDDDTDGNVQGDS